MLAERTLAFAAQAPDLPTKKALTDGLLTVLEAVGASNFACVYLMRDSGNIAIDRAISNLPRGWQELYLQQGYDAADPVFQGVARGGTCGYWDELTRGLVLGRFSREVMDQSKNFQMREGFTKRVALETGGYAVVMAAGSELVHTPSARAAMRMSFDIFANEGVRMMKSALDHGRAPGAGAAHKLSRTQLKVLHMRSDGLTNKQVAIHMGRHEKTVECHVTEILRRLGARNMIDAIRIATKLKLIL
jgi:DNA-binding CsgD family transcriptional regulator